MKRFSISLLIRHPNIDPKIISEELRLEPYACAKAGEPRVTPKGTPLQGVHDRSWWNHIFYYEGGVLFFEEAERLVHQLAAHKVFFLRIVEGKGDSTLYLQLPGDVNQGSTAKPSMLKLMAELELHLSAEVFPDCPLERDEHPGLTKMRREGQQAQIEGDGAP
jgi:hypothetical protein